MSAKPVVKPKPATIVTVTDTTPPAAPPPIEHRNWRNDNWKPAADDESMEAQMWRLARR